MNKPKLPTLAELFGDTEPVFHPTDHPSSFTLTGNLKQSFPVLNMLLNESIPLKAREEVRNIVQLKPSTRPIEEVPEATGVEEDKGTEGETVGTNERGLGSFYKPFKSDLVTNKSGSVCFKVAYRVSFKHTLKFKFINMRMPAGFTLQEFCF